MEENGEQVPCYSVMVSLREADGAEAKEWLVLRKLSEFQSLHRKLSEVWRDYVGVALAFLDTY